jgi:hypothetical protein
MQPSAAALATANRTDRTTTRGTRWRDRDLPALDWRRRRYDMRAMFITLAIEDGADPT